MSLVRKLSDVHNIFRRRSISSGENVFDDGEDTFTPLPLQRKLRMYPSWSNLSTSGSRAVRRSRSFNVKASKSLPPGMEPGSTEQQQYASPSSKKKHKALVVKKLAAKDVDAPTLTGYLERRGFSDQWMRYWYILKGSSLFCYLSPDDQVTVDILDLQGYKAECLVDKFPGKRFVLHLIHPDFSSVHLSLNTREEMEEWLNCVQIAKDEPPSSQAIVAESITSTEVPTDSYETKCVSVKQKLLEEMLRQKHELERKQAARQQKSKLDSSPSGKDMTTEEKHISYATNLRQRRLSTQIKMDTIQKQMQPQTSPGKKFFNFGKKKTPEKRNDHLQDQLKELSNKLQQIDSDLTEHINKSNGDPPLDLNQNRKMNGKHKIESDYRTSGNEGTENGDIIRGNSLKASVQKLANKTFSRSLKNKNKDMQITNGYISDSSIIDRFNSSDSHDRLNGDTSDSEEERSGSITDLTKLPGGDNVFEPGSQSDSRSRSQSKTSQSSYSSSRKEINPDIMAEIDAFEELTKQVLSARMPSAPSTPS